MMRSNFEIFLPEKFFSLTEHETYIYHIIVTNLVKLYLFYLKLFFLSVFLFISDSSKIQKEQKVNLI